MNYSHYITYPPYRDPRAFSLFIEDVQQIVENAPEGSELCDGEGNDGPFINNSVLIIGSKAATTPFSVLRISAVEPWPSHRYPMLTVTTNRLKYDSVICACLLAFLHHFPASTITTNGCAKDWAMGYALYEYATQRLGPSMEFHNEG